MNVEILTFDQLVNAAAEWCFKYRPMPAGSYDVKMILTTPTYDDKDKVSVRLEFTKE